MFNKEVYINLKSYLLPLTFLTILLFFYGYYLGENSAGAGKLDGDFNFVWNNLSIFKNNSFLEALDITAGNNQYYYYQSSRPPLIYILNATLNPFSDTKQNYITSIFIFSFLVYLTFIFALKKKYENELDFKLIFFLSSIILLSPYFRTSSFWGLEENFGIIALLFSFIVLNKLENRIIKNDLGSYFIVFLISIFSSLCVFFDQKLLLIPLICLFKIIFNKNYSNSLKYFLIFLFSFFSLPYLYLISIWGNIIPSSDSVSRNTLQTYYLGNIGYAITMLGFYIFPFLFFKKEKIYITIIERFKNRNFYYFLLCFLMFIILLIKFDSLVYKPVGNGLVFKVAILLFSNFEYSKFFLYFSFLISWIIIYLFVDNKKDFFIIFYFLAISIFIYPILQEYYDPIILIVILLFFQSKLVINYKNTFFLYCYYFIFLIVANIHYTYNFFFLFFK
ncbi:hypothetical protein PQY72_02525 [Pelagibacteraceae bacterium]|nr:hypothetical protein [Pelagibacteraceae bacterium]